MNDKTQEEFVGKLTPAKAASPKRLAAAMPMALASILVVATVAFGANVLGPIVVPDETPTPVVVGDEPTPTPEITPEPPAPTPTPEPVVTPEPTPAPVGDLTLTATLSGTKVVLTWTAYTGEDFAYYKIVRSTDAAASWPLGDGDKLVAAIGDQGKLTFTDAPPTGTTVSYEVFVVKCSEDGYVVMAASNLVTVNVPKPTPKPTQNCTMSLTASWNADDSAVILHWTKYRCDLFEGYVIIVSETNPKLSGPLGSDGQDGVYLVDEKGDVNVLTDSTSDVQAGHTYYFRVFAWNSQSFCYGGTVLAQTNIVKVTIPAAPAAS